MALAKNAPNVENATMLMDFLVSEPAQFIYGLDNHEYPVREGVAASKIVAAWGSLKADFVPLSALAKFEKKAAELVAKVGFDQGPGA
jgi:iron(III) transport system substrate-binding protein